MNAHAELRERVFEANLEILRAGLIVLTFGNVSGVDRSAGVMAIKPSGVGYDELRPESMVVVDLETGAALDGGLRPSSDTPTHLVLFRRFETVVHPLEMPAVLVRSHGPFAWGATEADAVENAIALEAAASMGIGALTLEPALGPISTDLLEKHFRRKHGPAAYYGQT